MCIFGASSSGNHYKSPGIHLKHKKWFFWHQIQFNAQNNLGGKNIIKTNHCTSLVEKNCFFYETPNIYSFKLLHRQIEEAKTQLRNAILQ